MGRLETAGIEPEEGKAADAIANLASSIEQLCYYQEARGIAAATVKELHRCFRVLKRACVFYGDDHGSCWDPPDYKFKPKGAK